MVAFTGMRILLFLSAITLYRGPKSGEILISLGPGNHTIRLSVCLAKRILPLGNLYDLTGYDQVRASWRSLREGRKRMVNALISVKVVKAMAG